MNLELFKLKLGRNFEIHYLLRELEACSYLPKYRNLITCAAFEKTLKNIEMEDFKKIIHTGSRQLQLESYLKLLSSHENDFLNMYREFDRTLVLESLKVIQHDDEVCRKLNSSPQICDLISYIANTNNTQATTLLLEIIMKNGNITQSAEKERIFLLSLTFIKQDDIELSEISCKLVQQFLTNQVHVYLPIFLTTCKEYMNQSIVLLRYCSVLCKVLAVDDSHFDACLSHGGVEIIWNLCQSNDVLTQVVAIEFLRYFAYTKSGLHYLFDSDIFHWLVMTAYSSIENEEAKYEPTTTTSRTISTRNVKPSKDPVLIAQCLREVSEIFYHAANNHLLDITFWSTILSQDIMNKFLSSAVSHLEDITDESRLTGIRVITDFIRTSPTALNMIIENSKLLNIWSNLLNSGKHDIQVATLHSYARVLETDYHSVDINLYDIDQKKIKLWHSIGEHKNMSTIQYLIRLVHQPVHSLRHASLDIMYAILKNDTIIPVSSVPSTVDNTMSTVQKGDNSTSHTTTSTTAVGSTSTSSSVMSAAAAAAAAVTTTTTTTTSSNTPSLARTTGLQLLCTSLEFREYIINQESEVNKEGREWKYSVIQVLSLHPHLTILNGLYSQPTNWLEQIHRIVKRGPHYIPSHMSDVLTMEH